MTRVPVMAQRAFLRRRAVRVIKPAISSGDRKLPARGIIASHCITVERGTVIIFAAQLSLTTELVARVGPVKKKSACNRVRGS